MLDTFAAWAALGALLHRAGNYAVVDRGALYANEQMPITVDRFQVVSHDQSYCRTCVTLDDAVGHAEDMFGEDLFALQTRVLERVRANADVYGPISSVGIACHMVA